MGGAGFEPAKAEPTDLQSVPFDRFGIPPSLHINSLLPKPRERIWLLRNLEPEDREGKASGGVRTHDLRFTKPLLCQLSYAGLLFFGKVVEWTNISDTHCPAIRIDGI